MGLDLGFNYLRGPIPPELGNLDNLAGLLLSNNQLTGAIPPELGNLTQLDWFYINNNHLDANVDGNALIPPEIQAWYDGITFKNISSQTPLLDTDGDGVPDDMDNCTDSPNPSQQDTDIDGIGNACDSDLNQDCTVDHVDLSIMKSVFFLTPADPDWNPDADLSSYDTINFIDLGIMKSGYLELPGPSEIPNLCD